MTFPDTTFITGTTITSTWLNAVNDACQGVPYVNYTQYNSLAEALATGQSVYIPSSVTTINVSVTDSPNVLPYLYRVFADSPVTIQLASGVHSTTTGNVANVGQNQNITVVGQTPSETSLISVNSVTGTTGNYDVVLEVGDASNISVNDYIKLDNVRPLLTLSGDNSVFNPRIQDNELLQCSALLGNAATTTGGTSVTFASVESGYVLSDIIQVNDLITIKGQTKQVTAVNDATKTLTVNSAWDLGTQATRGYWVSKPNSGTISTSGAKTTSIAGTGTAFTTQVNVGDMLLVNGAMVVITAITNDTSITIKPAISISGNAKYSVITTGLPHEGTFKVSAVNGNLVSVKNYWNGLYAPPVNIVNGGNIKVIKTILKNTGNGDGFSFQQNSSLKFLDNLVLLGNNSSTSSHGIALNGRRIEGPTQLGYVGILNGGSGLSVMQWGMGAFLGQGCVLQTRKSHYCANKVFGVWALENSSAILRECIVTSNLNRGLQLNAGSTTVFTEGYAIGNGADGVTLEIGATLYAEIPGFYQNKNMGITINGSQVHINEGIAANNLNSGIYAIGGACVEMERMLVVCNNRENIEALQNCSITATGAWASGCSGDTGNGYGLYIKDTEILFTNGVSVDNKGGPGWLEGPNAIISAFYSYIQGTENDGLYFENYATGILTYSKTEAVSVQLGGTVQVAGVSPVPALTGVARLNEMSSRGSIVKNDSSTNGCGFNSIFVNGGSLVNKLLQHIDTVNFGTIGGGATSTQTVSVSGITTADMVLVDVYNSSSPLPDGVVLTANITGTNVITVKAINTTSSPVSVNFSLRFLILGFA